jgi:hypothetical protein
MIIDLRSELENEHLRQASSVQKSQFNNSRSAIQPDFRVQVFLRQKPGDPPRNPWFIFPFGPKPGIALSAILLTLHAWILT